MATDEKHARTFSEQMLSLRQKQHNETSIFRAMPGYPWLPCPVCKLEGYPNSVEGCDHTVLERARVAHPGLVIPSTTRPAN